MRRRALSIALVAGLVVSVVFVLSAQGVYAGTKSKTLHLVKQIDDGTNKTKITYYDNGLMKKYSDGYEVRLFKYDSKGRMTESKIYKEKVKKANLRFKIKFVYSKKGKPEKIVRVVYKKGKVVSKDKLGLTVGKKNRIRAEGYCR